MALTGLIRCLPRVVGIAGLLTTVGCLDNTSSQVSSTPSPTRHNALSSETIQRIERFCGDCHPMPIPATFPKSRWPEEVRQGFDFYIESRRTDLPEPIRQDVVKYFQDAAPERVVVPRADQMPSAVSPVHFQPAPDFQLNGSPDAASSAAPAIAQLIWNAGEQAVYFSDMQAGTFRKWQPLPLNSAGQLSPNATLLATGRNFCKATVCDWDADGTNDFLIGEMGTFQVADHHRGRVTLLQGLPDGTFEPHVLADNLARVVQAVPLDYDEDGDLDVLVAEFGWRTTGGLKLLRNSGAPGSTNSLSVETLDPRHGVLGVEVADMNQDGKLDIVACYGQEFETVEIHFNQGQGHYTPTIVHRLKDPSYNASSFEVVDVDGDGRLDIVHTCGDTMDALIAKPYHGLRWIQNRPDGQWQNRELGLLVGALDSVTADFDGDGDLDIAAVGLFPDAQLAGEGAYDSVCWWEQREDLQFVRHSIERNSCSHAACEAADVNGDGRLDLIVGQWLSADQTAIRVFYNRPAN